jgi:hypothetical protein
LETFPVSDRRPGLALVDVDDDDLVQPPRRSYWRRVDSVLVRTCLIVDWRM